MLALFIFCVMFVNVSTVNQNIDQSHILNFTSNNFLNQIKHKDTFVMFYTDWCRGCQDTQLVWSYLAQTFNTISGVNLAIAQVQCNNESKLCNDHDVTGYPTLIYFRARNEKGVTFKGLRDIPSISRFIYSLVNINYNNDEPIKMKLHELTNESIESHVVTGQHFIMFYVPWCAYCQSLSHTWIEFAENMPEDFAIGRINCLENNDICKSMYDIRYYPTFYWISDGKVISEYINEEDEINFETLSDYSRHMLGDAGEDGADRKVSKINVSDSVLTLNDDLYEFHMKPDKGYLFVNYFAPWCAHCKPLVPVWLELGDKFFEDQRVIIAEMDCMENTIICEQETITRYPTLVLYNEGKVISQFEKSKSVGNLTDFLEKYLPQSTVPVEGKMQNHDEL